MSRIVLITGGARSGKSSFAESLLKDKDDVLYIATSVPFDEEMKDRVKKHKEMRNNNWETLECYKDVAARIMGKPQRHMLLDCLTIMVTNLMFSSEEDWDNLPMDRVNQVEAEISREVHRLIEAARDMNVELIMVTNELGMGIVPSNRLSRIFRDIAGRINQQAARMADEVYLLVSGIPMRIK